MQIRGLRKTTLLDYPGKVAATIFLGACNFRCPYCHNKDLVLYPHTQPEIEQDELLSFLTKRKGILDGVCITGGEPTLQSGLADFIAQIKELGFAVKLDTNGYRPDVLRELLERGLLNYVAMDIKSDQNGYAEVSGIPDLNLNVIQTSIDLLMSGNIEYEFRTTICRELHSEACIRNIASWLEGCRAYYLQPYEESERVIDPRFSSYTAQELSCFQQILKNKIPLVEIRGIES